MALPSGWEDISCELRPVEIARRWPSDVPLAALVSGGTSGSNPRARWSCFAVPNAITLLEADVTGGGHEGVFAAIVRMLGSKGAPAPLLATPGTSSMTGVPPLEAGWFVSLGYELGRDAEPAARHDDHPRTLNGRPRAVLARCDGVAAYDNVSRRWLLGGDAGAREVLRGVFARIAEGQRTGHTGGTPGPPGSHVASASGFRLGTLRSEMGRAAYEAAVARAVEYVHAGDVFQVNLAHHLMGAFEGSARALFAGLVERARPWYGAYLEWDGGDAQGRSRRRAICSASPELFVEVSRSSLARSGMAAGVRAGAATEETTIIARPMKGTRAASGGDAALHDLARSEKDAAELSMIIDLMRNDLGRIARLGSVRVDDPRAIEHHGEAATGVFQGVATVSAAVREGVGMADILNATFPPGSVTGAPKIRAMQIIEELEPLARGPYCGTMGFVSDDGNASLSVAIRTAMIEGPAPITPDSSASHHGASMPSAPGCFGAGSTLRYPVGAGIVAESDPAREWAETLSKAAAIAELAEGGIDPRFTSDSENRGTHPPTLHPFIRTNG